MKIHTLPNPGNGEPMPWQNQVNLKFSVHDPDVSEQVIQFKKVLLKADAM